MDFKTLAVFGVVGWVLLSGGALKSCAPGGAAGTGTGNFQEQVNAMYQQAAIERAQRNIQRQNQYEDAVFQEAMRRHREAWGKWELKARKK